MFCSDKSNQGGGVAAPVGGQIFSEVLPYLEIVQGNQNEVEEKEVITVPNIIGLSINEAERIIKENELLLDFQEDVIDKQNTIIKEQVPLEGIKINKGSKIFAK